MRRKAFRYLILAVPVVLVAGSCALVPLLSPQSTAAPSSMFANPSVETGTKSPTGWSTNKWGTNKATFSWVSGGAADGNRSVQVTVTSYKSGDAKWSPLAVPVTAGTAYTFTDAFKSNVITYLYAEYTSTTGAQSWPQLLRSPVSPGWTTETVNLTPPAGTKTVTILHVLAAVGTLAVDNYQLVPGTAAPPGPSPSATPTPTATPPPTPTPPIPSGVELVTNPGAESGSGSAPTGWTTDSWGTNRATFAWTNDAHAGTHALRVDVSGWQSGDAKWIYTPPKVAPGLYYQFSDWYKSSAQTTLWMGYSLADGSLNWVGLDTNIPPAANWTKYTIGARMPDGATSAFFAHILPGNGSLTTDDYSMMQAEVPPGFARGLVSFTFDDGIESTYRNGLPLLQKYGIPSTQYIISGYINTPGYVTTAEVQGYVKNGQEVGSHTVDHRDLTLLTPTEVAAELNNSRTTLQTITGPVGQPAVDDLALPYGAWNDSVKAAVQTSYSSSRTTEVGFGTPATIDPYRIKVLDVTLGTTADQVQGWITYAAQHNYWLVLVYHAVDPTSTDTYNTTPTQLDQELAAAKSSGLVPVTIRAGLAELQAH